MFRGPKQEQKQGGVEKLPQPFVLIAVSPPSATASPSPLSPFPLWPHPHPCSNLEGQKSPAFLLRFSLHLL